MHFRLQVPKVGDFFIRQDRIVYQRAENVTDDVLRLFLLGSCLGCVLQQRGYVVLHGNAVSTDGKTCQIVVGNQGAGKSTRAAWHFLRGDFILADDVCAVKISEDGQALVIPGFPQIKIWQASADLLGITTEGLRRVRPGFEKFGLPVRGRFQPNAIPLTEILEIDRTNMHSAPIEGVGKISALIHHSYRYSFLEKMGLASAYKRKILQLASRIKMETAPRLQLG